MDGGQLIFSVVTSNDNLSEDQRQLKDFYSTITNFYPRQTYRDLAVKTILSEIQVIDLSQNIVINYSRLLEKMKEIQSEEKSIWSQEFFEKMNHRLNSWIEAGNQDIIKWGFFHFQK